MQGTNKSPDLFPCDSTGHGAPSGVEAATLVDHLSKVIEARLVMRGAALVIGTRHHLDNLAEELGAMGLDLGRTVAEGRYQTLNLAGTLSQFMVDGLPEANRFLDLMGKTIAEARASARQESGMVIFSEMVTY